MSATTAISSGQPKLVAAGRGRSWGCQTCRTRKVKCGREFPECKRCTNSGRSCGGYGIWGGGTGTTNSTMSRASNPGPVVQAPRPQKISLLNLSPADLESLEWFERRAIPKLPGCSRSRCWSTMLSTASVSAPAVLHAILAVGSVHRARVVTESHQNILSTSSASRLNKQALQHYLAAIELLRAQMASTDMQALRVILLTCLTFTAFEILRGHIETARGHLHNGLRLLVEQGWITREREPTSIITGSPGSPEEWIVQVFKRNQLHLNVFDMLFSNNMDTHLVWPQRQAIPPVFRASAAVWNGILPLLQQSLWLTKTAYAERKLYGTVVDEHGLFDKQTQLRADLECWYHAYVATVQAVAASGAELAQKDLLHIVLTYKLTCVLTEVSLQDESQLQSGTTAALFDELLNVVLDLWHAVVPSSGKVPQHEPSGLRHSLIDMGGLHASYYVAVNARYSQVRIRALQILRLFENREGFWDSKLAWAAARKIVETDLGEIDDDLLSSACSSVDCSRPADEVAPIGGSRLREPKAILFGEPAQMMTLYHTVTTAGRDQVVKLAEYDVSKERWDHQASSVGG